MKTQIFLTLLVSSTILFVNSEEIGNLNKREANNDELESEKLVTLNKRDVNAKDEENKDFEDLSAPAADLTGPNAKELPTGLREDGDGDQVKVENLNKNTGFTHGFIATLSVIVVSELGDKTFFIAAIMAMRHSRLTVYAGAMGALGIMHIMSAFFGWTITVIPRAYTFYASSFLFAIFGLKMLREGYKMSPNEGQEEFEEVQEDLNKREKEEGSAAQDVETGVRGGGVERSVLAFVSKIFLQSFTMTFLAEWGDRSQLATIVLGAREDVTAVIIGGLLGHAFCTGLAVLGGRIIATRISVRTVTIIGGIVFIIFALSAFVIDPEQT